MMVWSELAVGFVNPNLKCKHPYIISGDHVIAAAILRVVHGMAHLYRRRMGYEQDTEGVLVDQG